MSGTLLLRTLLLETCPFRNQELCWEPYRAPFLGTLIGNVGNFVKNRRESSGKLPLPALYGWRPQAFSCWGKIKSIKAETDTVTWSKMIKSPSASLRNRKSMKSGEFVQTFFSKSFQVDEAFPDDFAYALDASELRAPWRKNVYFINDSKIRKFLQYFKWRKHVIEYVCRDWIEIEWIVEYCLTV